MKKILKILLIIVIVIVCSVLIGILGLKILWNRMITAQMAPDTYTSEVATGGDIEAKYMKMGQFEVKYFEVNFDEDEDIQKIHIWYPINLETEDIKVPVVLFINGTGVGASRYEPVFEHMASWGFISIGNEDQIGRAHV